MLKYLLSSIRAPQSQFIESVFAGGGEIGGLMRAFNWSNVTRACFLVLLSFSLLGVRAWPQSELAAVFGTVTDPSGAVIPAAQITIVNQDTGLTLSTVTDITGQYHVAGLPAGNYVVRAAKEGFQTELRDGVALPSGSGVLINFSMVVGSQLQQVTVNGDVSQIDNTTSTFSSVVAEASLKELPLDNRDLFSAVALEPGVAPDPSSAPSLLSSGKTAQVVINGIRPSMTSVLIDGMDVTDPVWGFSPAGASGFFLGLDELSEVRVLTQTFSAEYGGHGGAVIEMITKSGSNRFHGSLWEVHRDASLDAKNYFDLGASPIPPFVRNQFGVGIGGPLKRDHTFFFANYEGFREVEASTAIATAPDALAHEGFLPSAVNSASCTSVSSSGCAAIPINPEIQQFLNLMPPRTDRTMEMEPAS